MTLQVALGGAMCAGSGRIGLESRNVSVQDAFELGQNGFPALAQGQRESGRFRLRLGGLW